MPGAVFSELGAVFRKLKTGLFVSKDGNRGCGGSHRLLKGHGSLYQGRHQGAHSQPGGTF